MSVRSELGTSAKVIDEHEVPSGTTIVRELAEDTAADWSERIASVVAVAAQFAAAVDAEGRFPHEAIGECRAQRIFGAAVPSANGGAGRSIGEICELVEELGRVCASTAAIVAMHFSQELCLTRHVDLSQDSPLTELTQRVVTEQWLIASSTTEKNIGGDTRTSSCAVVDNGDGTVSVRKSAPVISYARYADAVFVTARSTPEAPSSEQSLVAVPKANLELDRTSEWDALGLRGTMSEGFELAATVPAEYVLPVDFATISARTMLPGSHTLWASSWLGLASNAGDVARKFVQKKARATPGQLPPGGLRLAELEIDLQRMTDVVRTNVQRFDDHAEDPEELSSMSFAIAMNTLKVSTSELVRKIVADAMVIVGIASYSNVGPLSLARPLRDAMGPSLQVNNDRILHNTATLQMVSRGRR
ncbi:acyl-CoA/acyl-ACP dehydrogenase [Kocuria sp. JC486]|uniref:Acyl-CoA dehydrogenase n=1 Tax=Kocuria soli TaxID=2485125 RepID=A0A3N3ZQ58_9MICC|nr:MULTISPECIES: acyl-CoA dehydrogenase family protein [Kocuria]NHU85374.1 acyl-CoA/acyl-ACP dehydrogenase [Kocuria sp. JC486]ROZ63263.1 acyl-CoA dehydrogenase [Kocuria soli]